MKLLARLLIVIALVLLFTGGRQLAGAQTLLGSQAQDSGSGLYNVDPATGTSTLIGDIGASVTGMVFDPFDGVLYGSTATIQSGSSIAQGDLISINPATGQGTDIGSFGFGTSGNGNTLADLTADSTGQLYGWRAGGTGDLYTVNRTTGLATEVGESGLTGLQGNGLAFSPTGTLYFAGNGSGGLLYTINPADGTPTGSVQLTGATTARKIGALAFVGATLFAIDGSNELLTINPSTGAVSDVGPTVSGLDGIAAIPEPPSSTIFLIGAALLLFTWRRCRSACSLKKKLNG
jgi:WD40 repeat protein